jgi:hypothetical protein
MRYKSLKFGGWNIGEGKICIFLGRAPDSGEEGSAVLIHKLSFRVACWVGISEIKLRLFVVSRNPHYNPLTLIRLGRKGAIKQAWVVLWLQPQAPKLGDPASRLPNWSLNSFILSPWPSTWRVSRHLTSQPAVVSRITLRDCDAQFVARWANIIRGCGNLSIRSHGTISTRATASARGIYASSHDSRAGVLVDKLQLDADEYDVSPRRKLVFSPKLLFKENEPQPTFDPATPSHQITAGDYHGSTHPSFSSCQARRSGRIPAVAPRWTCARSLETI